MSNTTHTDPHQYDDIIDLPHHVSQHHQHMSMLDRAAQFAPFAALTGHDAAVDRKRREHEEQALYIDTEPFYD